MLARKLGVSPEYLETGSELRDVDQRELRLADAELRLRIGGETEGAREAFNVLLQESTDAGDLGSAARARVGLGLTAAQSSDNANAAAQLQEAIDSGELTTLDRPTSTRSSAGRTPRSARTNARSRCSSRASRRSSARTPRTSRPTSVSRDTSARP
jgi:hypothetical protein